MREFRGMVLSNTSVSVMPHHSLKSGWSFIVCGGGGEEGGYVCVRVLPCPGSETVPYNQGTQHNEHNDGLHQN